MDFGWVTTLLAREVTVGAWAGWTLLVLGIYLVGRCMAEDLRHDDW